MHSSCALTGPTGRAPGQPSSLRCLSSCLLAILGFPSAPVHLLPSSLFLPTSHLNLQREPPLLLISPSEPSRFHLPLYCSSGGGGSSNGSLNLSGRDIVHIPEPGGRSSGCSYRVPCIRAVSVPASGEGRLGTVVVERASRGVDSGQACCLEALSPASCSSPTKICLQTFWLPELMDSTPLHKPHS